MKVNVTRRFVLEVGKMVKPRLTDAIRNAAFLRRMGIKIEESGGAITYFVRLELQGRPEDIEAVVQVIKQEQETSASFLRQLGIQIK